MKQEDFAIKNGKDWEKIHHSIFGDTIPKQCEWKNIEDIINILNKIGNVDASNHMFFPDGGGMDLDSVKKSHEKNCIELLTGITYIIKPKLLRFESIDKDFEWNYFRIECDNLKPSGVYKETQLDDYTEEVLELTPLKYINRSYWDENEYEGKRLPATARPLVRILKGSLVIFKKSSIYNHNSSTYDGRHEKLGVDGFRKHIIEAYKYIQEKK